MNTAIVAANHDVSPAQCALEIFPGNFRMPIPKVNQHEAIHFPETMDKCKIYNSAANINAFAGICC
jgi:hypothetical protein